MAWQATGWAFKSPIKNPGCKFVLVALAERGTSEAGDPPWTCHPSIKSIAEYTAQGARTIQRHLDWLEDNGYLTRTRRVQSIGRLGAYNFVLNPHQWATGQNGQRPETAPEVAPNGRTEPISRTDHGVSDAREADPFETWWPHYPKHVGKAEAVKAFWRALPKFKCDTPLTALIAETDRFAAESREDDPKFIPHPATWLNGERWNDEPRAVGGPSNGRGSPASTGRVDRAAERQRTVLDPLFAGAMEALNRRRGWGLGDPAGGDQSDPEAGS